jgi:hypothetical protein
MRVSTVSAIVGLAAGFASAAPVQPREVQDREAAPQWYGECLEQGALLRYLRTDYLRYHLHRQSQARRI